MTAPDDLRKLLEISGKLLSRYLYETPLGHQPHMIAIDTKFTIDSINKAIAAISSQQDGWLPSSRERE